MSSSRSHHVHPDRLPIVQKAFELRYTSQSKFGEDVPCTRSTVFNFLKGKNVERYILKRCCELLGLEVETIVSPINSNPPVELESVLAEEPPSDGEGVVPSQVIPKNLAAPLLTPNTHEEIRWVGRESLVQDLIDRLSQDCRVLMLVGMTGIGKTSLGLKLRDDLRSQFPNPIDISFDTDQPSFNQILKAIFGKTVTPLGTDPRPSDALLPDLIHHLQTYPTLLFLDMAEGLMRSTSNGFEFNDPIFEKFLTLVLQVEPFPSCIILTSQDQPPTPALGRYQGRSYLHRLKGLTENEGLQLFHAWNLQPQNPGEIEYLQRIIRVYEGHPLALRVIAGEIGAYPYEGRIAQYWAEFGLEIEQVEQIKANPELTGANDRPNLDRYSIDLVDLVKRRIEKTVERLYVQNPLACLMLCEGAVYRRGAERSAWFTLMEEYTDDLDQHHLAFQTLQRRYLLQSETIAGGKTGYRLHSLVRRVALENMERMEADFL